MLESTTKLNGREVNSLYIFIVFTTTSLSLISPPGVWPGQMQCCSDVHTQSVCLLIRLAGLNISNELRERD